MNRYPTAIVACAVFAMAAPAQPSQALFGAYGEALQYMAAVETRADRIDDVFNASADDGWRPRFVLNDRGRHRLLFARPLDGGIHPMEYSAETVLTADDIAARFNEMAQSGWRPLFVFTADFRYRMLFEREKGSASPVDREYRGYAVGDARILEDVFNAGASEGWRPLFLLSATDSTELRMLVARDRAEVRRAYRYAARTVRSPRLIDDVFNEMSKEGWRPVFTIPLQDQHQVLFEQTNGDSATYEHRAIIVEESHELDDALNRYASLGWKAVDLLREHARRRYRLLLARPTDTAGARQGAEP